MWLNFEVFKFCIQKILSSASLVLYGLNHHDAHVHIKDIYLKTVT